MADFTAKETADVFNAITAIKLLRHKGERGLNRYGKNMMLGEDDINEVLIVAGFPPLQRKCNTEEDKP